MPPRTRPTNTKVSDNEKKVHNYLHDTMAVLFELGSPSDISPWLLYGPPNTPIYNAEQELSSLQVMSNSDYKSIIPTKLTEEMGLYTPELYYDLVRHFSKMSTTHSIYTTSTPEGFRGHYDGPSDKIDKLQKYLDAQFDQMIRRWVDVPDTYSAILLTKNIVDREILPELISSGLEVEGNLRGHKFHELYVKACEGDVLPLVDYCVAGNFPRKLIIMFVDGVMYSRMNSMSNCPTYIAGLDALKKNKRNIQNAVSFFVTNLKKWRVIDEKPCKKEFSSRSKALEQSLSTHQNNCSQEPSNKRKNKNFNFKKNKRGKGQGSGTWKSNGNNYHQIFSNSKTQK